MSLTNTAKWLLITFFILVFMACKKENTSIKANVWDLSLDKPYEDAKVSLRERKSTLSWESDDWRTIATETTDENGNCEFIFHTRFLPKYSYHLFFEYDDKSYAYDFKGLDVIDNIAIEKKESNSVRLNIAPAAGVKTTVSNNNPFDNNDNITVYAINNYFEQTILTYTGISGKTNSDYIGVLAGRVILKWDVIKNNIKETFWDTIYLAHDEKKEFYVNF